MKKAIRGLILVPLIASLTACTWVRLDPGAEDVVVLPEDRVQECERLGSVEVSVLARVAGMDRHEEEVEKDLISLARNHAVEKGGDTIAALSEVKDGEQRFGIYRCAGKDVDAPDEDEEDEEGVTIRSYNS